MAPQYRKSVKKESAERSKARGEEHKKTLKAWNIAKRGASTNHAGERSSALKQLKRMYPGTTEAEMDKLANQPNLARAKMYIEDNLFSSKPASRKKAEAKKSEESAANAPKFNFKVEKEKEKEADTKTTNFRNSVENALTKIESNPAGVTDEDIAEMSHEIVVSNSFPNSDLLKEIFESFRDSSKELLTSNNQLGQINLALDSVLQGDLNNVSVLADKLSNFFTVLRLALSDVTTEKNALAAQNSAAASQISRIETASAEATLKLREALNTKNDLKSQLITATSKVREYEAENSRLSKEYDKGMIQIRNLNQQISESTAQYQARIEGLEAELEQKKHDWTFNQEQKALLEQRISSLQIDYDESVKKVAETRAELNQLDGLNKELAAKNRNHANEIVRLQQQLSNMGIKYSKLQAALDAKTLDYNRAIEDKNKAINDYQNTLSELTAAKIHIQNLESEIAEKDAEIESYQNQIRVLNNTLAEKDKALAILRSERLVSEDEQKQAVNERLRAQEEIKALKAKIRSLEDANKVANATIVEYKAKWEQAEAGRKNAENEVACLNKLLQAQKDGYAEEKKTREKIQNDVQVSIHKLDQAVKAQAQAANEANTAKLLLAKAQADYLKLQDESKSQIDKAQSEIVKLKAQVETYQAQLEAVTKPESTKVEPVAGLDGVITDDVVMGDAANELVQVSSVDLTAPQLISVLNLIADKGTRKQRSTGPSSYTPSAAAKKRSLGTGGAYLVGGRPDPSFNDKYWKALYAKGFKVF